ncbi:MAG: hypothetical protein JSW52_02440, partial [Candidatus Coatesbacteria bacterium]
MTGKITIICLALAAAAAHAGTVDVYAGFVNFGRGPVELDQGYWGYRLDAALDTSGEKWGFHTDFRLLRLPGDISSTGLDWDFAIEYYLTKTPIEAYVGPNFGLGYAISQSIIPSDSPEKVKQSLVRFGFAVGARVPLGKPYFTIMFTLTPQITLDKTNDKWIEQNGLVPGFNVFPELALEGEVGYPVREHIGVSGKVGFIGGNFLLKTKPYENNELVPYFQ